MSQPFKTAVITEPVLIKNPTGEGHINIRGFINALLEWSDSTKAEEWPQKLEQWKETIDANNDDIAMNIDIEDIGKTTYQNIIHRSRWTLRMAQGIELVHI